MALAVKSLVQKDIWTVMKSTAGLDQCISRQTDETKQLHNTISASIG
jgi:hypothetical protein